MKFVCEGKTAFGHIFVHFSRTSLFIEIHVQGHIWDGTFAKIVKGFQPLTVFAKRSILDFWLGFEYVCVTFLNKKSKKEWQIFENFSGQLSGRKRTNLFQPTRPEHSTICIKTLRWYAGFPLAREGLGGSPHYPKSRQVPLRQSIQEWTKYSRMDQVKFLEDNL